MPSTEMPVLFSYLTPLLQVLLFKEELYKPIGRVSSFWEHEGRECVLARHIPPRIVVFPLLGGRAES